MTLRCKKSTTSSSESACHLFKVRYRHIIDNYSKISGIYRVLIIFMIDNLNRNFIEFGTQNLKETLRTGLYKLNIFISCTSIVLRIFWMGVINLM